MKNNLQKDNMVTLAILAQVGMEVLEGLANGGSIPHEVDKNPITEDFIKNTMVDTIVATADAEAHSHE